LSVLSQTALVRHETEYKLSSNSSGSNEEARGHAREQLRLQAMQLLRRSVAFVVALLLSVVVGKPCSGGDSAPAQAKGKGRMTIVYQEDAIQPENRDAIKKIMDSGVFERMAA
jgi:hypothetical protein